jgi:ribonuclease-3
MPSGDRENRSSERKRRYRQLEALQKITRIKFRDKSLLNRAMTHRSFVNESGRSEVRDNERLEYLGDSVLALVVNEYLFKHFDSYPEGNLAKIKSAIVSERELAKVARSLNLGSFIMMGKGEEQSGGRERPSILANTLEALIGAIYLDAGFKEARKFILPLLKQDIELIDKKSYLRDPKTTLQEYVQKKHKSRPEYRVVRESGPDHQKHFIVTLLINEQEVARGEGSSKRKAEMSAATQALRDIEQGDGLV